MDEQQRIEEVIAEAQSYYAYVELMNRLPDFPTADDYEQTLEDIIIELEYTHCANE